MSDQSLLDDSNPFLKLNKKQFRDATAKAAPGQPVIRKAQPGKAPAKATAAATPPASPEDDDLFSLAMSGVNRMAKPSGKGQPAGAGRSTPPRATPQQEPAFKMQEQESFQQLLDAKDGKKKAPPATQHPDVRTSPRREDVRQRSRHAVEETHANPAPQTDDEASFAAAMRGVAPVAAKGRAIAPEMPPQKSPLQAASNPLQDFMDGKIEFALEFTDEYLEGHVVGLDTITIGKLRAGQYSPEAHLDLHGMNAIQAYDAVIGFFRGAYHKGLRTVLVIPGRGKNSPDGLGVLRDKVQNWLTHEPLKRVVLAFATAQPAHGGAGALYVLLRKFKKSRGKIQWDRTPTDADLFL